MSAPSPNADPERGEVPNTAAVVTRKWGTLRNFAANEEGRRKLNRAAAAPEGGRAKVLWGSLKDRVKVSEKVDPIEEKAEGLAERKPKYSIFEGSLMQLHHTRHFDEVRQEVLRATSGQTIQDRDVDALHDLADYTSYLLENSVSAIPGIALYLLVCAALVITVILAILWILADGSDRTLRMVWEKVFITVQVLTTGAFANYDAIRGGERAVFLAGLLMGIVLVAILLAIITEAFSTRMAKIAEGKTKVVERGHTLILGWNESTIRIVCQIAFLRRGFLKQNETWARFFFWWLRVQPSSPVARAPVIVMADNLTKEEMDSQLKAALAERGISPHRTCIGWDVVCRVGKPDDPHDLIRVNAHEATAILITTTEKDLEMEHKSNGKLKNGATIRTLLALRHVLYSNEHALDTMDARNIRIVSQFCRTCEYSDSATFVSPKGHRIVFNLDLNYFTNALMFWCAAKPGLSQVYLQILNFEGVALRCRPARELLAGPRNEKGYLVNKTVKEVILGTFWKDAIMMGLCPDERLSKNSKQDGLVISGCCTDPEHLIVESDLIIFLGSSSTPSVSSSSQDLTAFDNDKPIAKEEKLMKAIEDSTNTASSASPVHILVCGWRLEWSDGDPLNRRLVDIASRVPKGSSITFLNELDHASFTETMKLIGLQELDGAKGWRVQEVDPIRMVPTELEIYHITGDAADILDLSPLLSGEANVNRFQTAVILANTSLPRELQDARVLSILLLLRHLSKKWTDHLHVIADNQKDQTALIAVAPNNTNNVENLPDFLPSTTIEARALTMALAYPHMQGAIEEFFVDENPEDGTPEVGFIEAKDLGLLGLRVKFAQVAKTVQQYSSGWAVAFGYMTAGGKMILGPPPGALGIPLSEPRPFVTGDRIILMRRMFVGGKSPKRGVSVNS